MKHITGIIVLALYLSGLGVGAEGTKKKKDDPSKKLRKIKPLLKSIGFDNEFSTSEANGVSSNGKVVVGASSYEQPNGLQVIRAFRWTSDTGIQDLGVLEGERNTGDRSVAFDTNCDGSVVVGDYFFDTDGCAFRWTSETGIVLLCELNDGGTSFARGVSDDGSVVVGFLDYPALDPTSPTIISQSFFWTSKTGIVKIGDVSGEGSFAEGVSGNGKVVVGTYDCGTGTSRNCAYRTTELSAEDPIVPLGGDCESSLAYGVNIDGSVVVGICNNVAFRWTSNTDIMEPLGVLEGGSFSYGIGVSSDGLVVVGFAGSADGNRAIRWTSAGGLVDLNTYLQERGVDITGWVLQEAKAASSDGSTIVGYGTYNGTFRAFVISNL